MSEYYSTEIGEKGHHSGGQWIKALEGLDSFSVYYGIFDNPPEVEHKMLEYYMTNVSHESLSKLYDKQLPLPYANIKFKGNKKHGLKNQRL